MKDDYTPIFRNIRTARRFDASEYRRTEPGWVSWAGGMALGVLFALLLVHWMMAW